MTSKTPIPILTDDEEEIVDLLNYIGLDAGEFEDPENGDFLDRMEEVLRNANELDATVVKIALDRTYYYLDELPAYRLSAADRERALSQSPAKDRLVEALESTVIIETEGVKKEVLEAIDKLHVSSLGSFDSNRDPKVLLDLIRLIVLNNVKDEVLAEFVCWGLLTPWNDFIGTDWFDDGDVPDLTDWLHKCEMLNATQWGRV